ncbi:hypothetical protein [Gordonia polyisoprenivorans]|nr:hypothetical protein [Gordonia polyisoprenivorans]
MTHRKRTLTTTLTPLIVLTALSLSAAVLSACATTPSRNTHASSTTTSPQSADGYQRPPNVAWTENWNPSPATDLMSADATFLRAYEEAQDIAIMSGYTASGAYPGFATADRSKKNPRLYVGGPNPGIYRGFATRTVLSLTDVTPETRTATICVALSINPINKLSISYGIDTVTYRHTRTPPPTNQHGTRQAPTGNVFGDWYATDDIGVSNSDPTCTHEPVNQQATPTPGWPEHGV